MSCIKVIEMLQKHINGSEVVVAGGAVRDELLGSTPKDYDAFVLCPDTDLETAKLNIADTLADVFGNTETNDEGSSVWIACEANYAGIPVQVIVSQCPTLNSLLDTFDWNVCLFGQDHCRQIRRADIGNVSKGGKLCLQTVTNPLSSLRRGFRFCERYGMWIDKPDLVRLCSEVLAQNLLGELSTHEEEILNVAF